MLRRFKLLMLTAVIAVGALVVPASPAAAASGVPIGWYRIRSLERPGECMQADPATAPLWAP